MENNNFWKDFSRNIFKIFEPITKVKNQDLLIEIEENPSNISVPLNAEKVSIRSSFLTTKYKNYDPMFQKLLNKTRNYNRIERRRLRKNDRPPLSVLPSLGQNELKPYLKDYSLPPLKVPPITKIQVPLQVHGQKASSRFPKVTPLPLETNPIVDKIQAFLAEVYKKYDFLYKEIDSERRNIIMKENIHEFVKAKIREGSGKTSGFAETQNNSFSPKNAGKEQIASAPEIMSVFDPFSTGIVTRQFFFGILAMHEYSAHGMNKLPLPSSMVDITDPKHIVALKSQVYKLKAVFCQYSDGKTMRREEFLRVISSISESPLQAKDVVNILEIGNSVSFGQFLLAVPYLLENYDKLATSS